jgi:hypothetical protein
MAVAVPFPSRRARHPAGLAAVAGLHGVLVWMLVQSLGHRGVDPALPPLAVDILEPSPPPLDARGRPVGGFATVESVWTLQ